jgi:uncharacterized protein YciI
VTGTASPADGSVFLLVLTYTQPLEEIDALLPAHRRWLDEQYAAGTFLASGPRVPRAGGVILACGLGRDGLATLVATDPFAEAGAAAYDIVEFQPNRGPLAGALLADRPPSTG